MTENEAIQALKLEGGIEITGNGKRVADFIAGLEIAISALKEIQKYREIGTVEECKELASMVTTEKKNVLGQIVDEWKEYIEIGTVKECREAREKQEGMQVNEIHVDEYFCPACGSENNNGDIGCPGDHYCPVCGQAIYW